MCNYAQTCSLMSCAYIHRCIFVRVYLLYIQEAKMRITIKNLQSTLMNKLMGWIGLDLIAVSVDA